MGGPGPTSDFPTQQPWSILRQHVTPSSSETNASLTLWGLRLQNQVLSSRASPRAQWTTVWTPYT